MSVSLASDLRLSFHRAWSLRIGIGRIATLRYSVRTFFFFLLRFYAAVSGSTFASVVTLWGPF